MISYSGRYYDALGHLHRDRSSTDPLRGVLLKTSNGKRPPRVNLAVREENVGWVHVPSAVSFVEGIDIRFRWNRSLGERAQTGLLLVIQSYELRLNTSVVVRISGLVETYTHPYNQAGPHHHAKKGVNIPNSVQYWYVHESVSASSEGGPAIAQTSGSVSAMPVKKASKATVMLKAAAKPWG